MKRLMLLLLVIGLSLGSNPFGGKASAQILPTVFPTPTPRVSPSPNPSSSSSPLPSVSPSPSATPLTSTSPSPSPSMSPGPSNSPSPSPKNAAPVTTPTPTPTPVPHPSVPQVVPLNIQNVIKKAYTPPSPPSAITQIISGENFYGNSTSASIMRIILLGLATFFFVTGFTLIDKSQFALPQRFREKTIYKRSHSFPV